MEHVSSYPDALDDLTAEQADFGATAVSAWVMPSAVEAVQAELGTNPAGEYSSVKARLDAMAAAVIAAPEDPASITGARSTDGAAILAALLTALDGLGLISDDTTAGS